MSPAEVTAVTAEVTAVTAEVTAATGDTAGATAGTAGYGYGGYGSGTAATGSGTAATGRLRWLRARRLRARRLGLWLPARVLARVRVGRLWRIRWIWWLWRIRRVWRVRIRRIRWIRRIQQLGLSVGMATATAGYGYGPSNWLYGGSLYGYGYSPYSNPYSSYASYASPGVVVAPFDYSQPINTVSTPPAQSVMDEASTLFGSARRLVQGGQLCPGPATGRRRPGQEPQRLVLARVPRLCLFALGRYDEAATALYAVLSVGPGWDWPTLIGLYPNVNVYTAQLRALEDYCKANPQSSSSRFVLAYHYLTQGHIDAAANMLKQVVALKPNDTLSAKLLEQLQPARQNPAATAAQPPPPPAPEAGSR